MAEFEDMFFDELVDAMIKTCRAHGDAKRDDIWNESLQTALRCVCNFFGQAVPSRCDITRKETEHDAVNHPSHYCRGGMETLDYILAKDMDFLLGQVCKYISRAGYKDPAKELEDLRKAQFYLNKKIEELECAKSDS